MNRLILVLLLGCLSWNAYSQVLPNGKTPSPQTPYRVHNNAPKQPKKGNKPQILTEKFTVWDNMLSPNVFSTALVTAPHNCKKILRSHPCWSVTIYNFRYSHKGRSYKRVQPQTKDIFRICEFTAKGVRVYYTPETAIPRSFEIPFFVEELVPYDKVEVLGCNDAGEYVISVVVNKDWNALLRIKPSSRKMLNKHKILVKTSAKIAKYSKDIKVHFDRRI